MLIDMFEYGICRFSLLKNDLIPCRAEQRIPENAQSVITVLFPYNLGEKAYENRNISRYAVPEDYHKICLSYLEKIKKEFEEKHTDEVFECFCDNSPVKEVRAAALSSLGVIGKNGLLINKKYGSYVFIGEIVTTARLKYTESEIESCLECGKCEKACESGGIKNKSECLSAITQQKGEIENKYKSLIRKSGVIWGCDICQEVCPMNENKALTKIPEFTKNTVFNIDADTCLENRAFEWRGKSVIKRNSDILL